MQVGPYTVEAEVGRGAMGRVLRGRAPDGRAVAIKLLNVSSAEARARFERERRLLWSFSEADGFVPVIGDGDANGIPYLVMPFVQGGTLRARLERGPLPIEEGVAIVEQVARALGRAHERGVVHRDLKPENILFTAAGVPLVSDLGLAKHFRSDVLGASRTAALSQAGGLLGTPGYMPPEQMADAQSARPASDVFALGAILHEALAGSLPFSGATLLDLIAHVEEGRPTALREVRGDVPPWLEAVVLRALARDPAKRFADGGAFARALAAGGAASRRGRPALVALVALIALVALGGAGVAAWFAFERRAERAPPRRAPTVAPVPSRARTAPVVEPGFDETALLVRAKQLADSNQVDAALAQYDWLLARRESVAGLVARAQIRIAREDLEGALSDATRAVAAGADEPLAWCLRAQIRWRRGDPGALEDADRAVACGAPSAKVLTTRAELRMAKGETDGALEDLERALGEPRSLATRYARKLRARARWTKGDLAAALEDLTAVVESDGFDLSARADRGVLRSVLGDIEGGRSDLDAVLATVQNYGPFWAARGTIFARAQDWPRAIADFDQALALAPEDASMLRERSAAHRNAGDLARARADARRALELAPRDADAWCVLAAAEAQAGDRGACLDAFDRAMALAPDSPGILTLRAYAQRRFGRMKEALDDLDRALALRPETALGWSTRSGFRQDAGDLRGARADSDRALALAPKVIEVLRQHASVRAEEGDVDGALGELGTASALDPRSSLVHCERSEIQRRAGRTAAALREAEIAVALLPTFGYASSQRAIVRARTGDLAGALEDAERALALAPLEGWAFATRAEVRFRRGEHDAAIADATRALEIFSLSNALGVRGLARKAKGEREAALADIEQDLARRVPDLVLRKELEAARDELRRGR